MIRPHLRHATGKIADGDANCLYAVGLFSLRNTALVSTDSSFSVQFTYSYICILFISISNILDDKLQKPKNVQDYIFSGGILQQKGVLKLLRHP